MTAPRSLAEIAQAVGLELRGDGSRAITGVATLAGAGSTQIAFLANPRYRGDLRGTQAAAVVLHPDARVDCPVDVLLSVDPYAAFARIAALFETHEPLLPGIDASAVIAADAVVSPDARIGPHCSIGTRARIAAGCQIGPGCVIGEDCVLDAGCTLVARVTLVKRVRLGQRVLIHPGAVLGADGFGLAVDQGRWRKLPQLGGVRIGDDCEIGANTTIDRGALDDTVLEEDVRLDNQIQIGHNVRIGAHTAIAGCAAIAGSAMIGRWCRIGGGAGIVGHIEIADRVTIAARSLVTHSLREAGEYASGTPLQPLAAWRRNAVRFKQLDRLWRRLRDADGD